MIRVFLTIDTELSMSAPRRDPAGVREAIDRDIFGHMPAGAYGIGFQLDRFREHGIKATFLVESLFAEAVGLEPLKRIVAPIVDADQEAQLHLHP